MGYMHITSIYKWPEFIEAFKQVYAMEKIHGTSVWITHNENNELQFHSGGENRDAFVALFDQSKLHARLCHLKIQNQWKIIKIHGEAYGGKQQKMAHTYGPKLQFIVFDVRCDGQFLDVPVAESIARQLDLEFVHYQLGPCESKWIEEQANLDSVQAVRNGMGQHPREGVVIRPLNETRLFFRKEHIRAIAKHKNAAFMEVKTKKPLGEKLSVMTDVVSIVDEWVTDERLKHVIDRVLQTKDDKTLTIRDITQLIDLMVEDVQREGDGEMVWSENLVKSIRKQTGAMFKIYLQTQSEHHLQ